MRFSKEIYPKIALIKSAYAFTDKAYIHLDADETHYLVSMQPKKGFESISEEEFTNEMLAQCARHEIYLQTKTLRELLVARAVASTVVELPSHSGDEEAAILEGENEDLEVAANDDMLAEQIFSDWFDVHDVPRA